MHCITLFWNSGAKDLVARVLLYLGPSSLPEQALRLVHYATVRSSLDHFLIGPVYDPNNFAYVHLLRRQRSCFLANGFLTIIVGKVPTSTNQFIDAGPEPNTLRP
jgi:hypothetical protein